MKPNKLIACLVTLLACGLPFTTASGAELRTWTDTQGRTIEARLLDTDTAKATIRIERADGLQFTLPLARLSEEDRRFALQQAADAAGKPALRELEEAHWEWLARSGSIQPKNYVKVPAGELIALLNVRLSGSAAKKTEGALSGARLDAESGVDEITTEVRATVSLATFLREMARDNDLKLMVDSAGALVIRRAARAGDTIEFLGVGS